MLQYLVLRLMWLPIILLSLSLHETAHGYAAYKLGDPTARNLGRLTLNPLKHLDITGFVCMLLVGFGWAKPVPINSRNFKNPRSGMALSSLAGPLSNLLLAVLFTLLYGLMSFLYRFAFGTVLEAVVYWTFQFFFYGVYLNVALAIFNLLPVPPLDGSRIFYVFLPPKFYFGVMKYERYIGLGFLIIFFVLSRIGMNPISFIVEPITNGLLWLVGVR